MKRLAVFVEGQTEQIFVERAVQEIAGARNVHIDTSQAYGGKKLPRSIRILKASAPSSSKSYYVLIVDSSGDKSVVSDIREEYANLSHKGGGMLPEI